MRKSLIAIIFVCICGHAHAKGADFATRDCTYSMLAVIVEASHDAGETVPQIHSEPMLKMQNGLSDLCTIIYTQGLAARSARNSTLARTDVKRSIGASIAANTAQQLPAEVVNRMVEILTNTFMSAYAYSPEAD